MYFVKYRIFLCLWTVALASLALWKHCFLPEQNTLQSGGRFSSETSVFIRPLALPVWQDGWSLQRNVKGALKRRRKWGQTPAAWSRSGRHNGSYIKHAEICRNYCCHRSYPSCLRLHTDPHAGPRVNHINQMTRINHHLISKRIAAVLAVCIPKSYA